METATDKLANTNLELFSNLFQSSTLGWNLYHSRQRCFHNFSISNATNFISEKSCEQARTITSQLKTIPENSDFKAIGKSLTEKNCTKRMFFLTFQSGIFGKLMNLHIVQPKAKFYLGNGGFYLHTKGWRISKAGPGLTKR